MEVVMDPNIEKLKREVIKCIDEQELSQLILALANIYSPFQYDQEAGNYVYEWMEREGFKPRRVGMNDRFNVVGKLEGTGGGYNLLFSSHLDTQGPRGQVEDSWMFLPESMQDQYWHSATMKDGIFHGQGVDNDKGPMACFLMAAKALKNAGVPLKGDIYLTACSGELGQKPVSEYQGGKYVNKDSGAEFMMIHGGIMADYGVAAEGTDFKVSWVEAGKAFFKITVHGSRIYTPWVTHTPNLKEHRNPIVKAAVLIEALTRYGIEYEQKHTVSLKGGTIVPKMQISAIRGGIPHYIVSGTELCELYLDFRIVPGMIPGEIYKDLKRIVSETGLTADIELFLFRQGYEADYEKIQPLVRSLEKSHADLFGTKLEMADPVFSSMWRDHNVFNEYRIASLTYGPPRYDPSIVDMLNCARVYAMLAMQVGLMENE